MAGPRSEISVGLRGGEGEQEGIASIAQARTA